MIDIIFVILIIGAIIKGYQKGFIIALFSIFALIAGMAAALKFSAAVALYLQNNVSVPGKWLPLISFLLVFFIVVFLVHLGGRLIEKTFEIALLGWLNRLAGIIVYVILYTIIFSIFLFYADNIHVFEKSTIDASQTYPYVQPVGPKVINSLGRVIPLFKDMFEQLAAFFEGVTNKIHH